MAEENDINDIIDTNDTAVTETDIFKTQEKTAELLHDVILRQQTQAGQPTYITQVAERKPPPNYLLYVAIGIGALILFKT